MAACTRTGTAKSLPPTTRICFVVRSSKRSNDPSDAVVACYGTSRPELQVLFSRSLDSCVAELPSEQRERIAPSHESMLSLAKCTNFRLFDRVGKTPSQLAACLPTKP